MSDVLIRIAQEREKRVADLHLDLPIPSWDGSLVGRFHVLPRNEVEKFSQRKAGVEADSDFIIRATHELYILDAERNIEAAARMTDNEDYVRIEDNNGVPVLWTATLAEKLGQSEITTARAVLTYCFAGNGIAISGFSVKLVRWMQNTDTDVAQAISGE